MTEEILKHKWAYLVLILFLGVCGFLFLAVWPDRSYQRYLIALMTTFYFFWGILTHFKSEAITKKIVLEYLGVSLLAGVLLFLVTV